MKSLKAKVLLIVVGSVLISTLICGAVCMYNSLTVTNGDAKEKLVDVVSKKQDDSADGEYMQMSLMDMLK